MLRVIQRGQRLRFALETSHALRVTCASASGRTLMRDLAIQLGVAGAIHLAHAARADGRRRFRRGRGERRRTKT